MKNPTMIYVIDIETTGLDPHRCGIVQIGATELWHRKHPFFMACRPLPGTADIDPEALAVNGTATSDLYDITRPSTYKALLSLMEWMRPEGIIAGCNVHFDHAFLAVALRRYGLTPLPFRLLDLHSIAAAAAIRGTRTPKGWVDLKPGGIKAGEIYRILDMPPEPKPHHGLRGAVWTAEALRRALGAAPDRAFWEAADIFSPHSANTQPKEKPRHVTTR